MSIERRLFRLVLLTGLLCFILFEAVSLFGMYDVERRTVENSREMGESAAAFAENIADEAAKKRLTLFVGEKARGIGTDLERLREDTEILAKTMTRILTHKDEYLPCDLPIGGETPIRSKEPYSPAARYRIALSVLSSR